MNQTVVEITTQTIQLKIQNLLITKQKIDRSSGKLEGNETEKEVEIVASLKHLSNFWRALDMPWINCKINIILTWSENY